MPVEHAHTIKAGTVGKVVLVYARDASGDGCTGLSAADVSAAFVREGDTGAARVPVVAGTVGQHAPGAFAEVDSELAPGLYQFGVPDAALAEGAERVVLVLQAANARIEPVDVQLVAYDPQDPERMGVRGLADDKRHEFLRRALPGLTQKEFDLGREAERELRELRARLAAEPKAPAEGGAT